MAVVQSREKWLDALKGFCMILVLFSHANAIPPVGGFLCACYMQVFFFVAGYTYKEHTSEIFQNFILRKFKRLMVPYFGYSTILLILYAIHQRLNPAQIAWGGVGILYAKKYLYPLHTVNNISLLDNGNSVLWFLPAMFLSYLFFWILIHLKQGFREGLLAGYFLITLILAELPFLLPWSLDMAFLFSLFMYAGHQLRVWAAQRAEEPVRAPFTYFIWLGSFAIYLLLVKIDPNINTSMREFGSAGWARVPIYIGISLLGSLLYMSAFYALDHCEIGARVNGMLAKVGQRTIVLMATHIAIFFIVETVFEKLELNLGYVQSLLQIITALLFGFAMNDIVLKLSRKVGFLRYFT